MFCQKYMLPLLNVEKYARLFICLFSIVWPIKCNFCCWITLLLFCTWRGHYDGYWKFSCLLPNIATAFNAIWQGELGNSNCIALIHKKFADLQLIGKFCCLHEKCVYIFFTPLSRSAGRVRINSRVDEETADDDYGDAFADDNAR